MHASSRFWARTWSDDLHPLNDRTIHGHDDAAFFQSLGVLLVIGITGELATVFLVFGQRRELDESESLIRRAREFCRQEVTNYLAAAATDWLLLRLRVGLEISKLVGIERVTDGKRQHWSFVLHASHAKTERQRTFRRAPKRSFFCRRRLAA